MFYPHSQPHLTVNHFLWIKIIHQDQKKKKKIETREITYGFINDQKQMCPDGCKSSEKSKFSDLGHPFRKTCK